MSAHRAAYCWLRLVAACILCTIPVGFGHAQEGGLRETFDDPALPGWEHPPEVAAIDGILRVPAPGFAFWMVNWGDLTLSLRARLSGEGELVIGYSATDAGMYQIVLRPDGASLVREAGGVAQEMMVAPSGVPLGEWFQLEISAIGGEHAITLNGQALLEARDPEPLPPGGVFLHARGAATGEFDELIVTATSGQTGQQLPAGGTPQAAGVPAYQAGAWVKLGGPAGGIGYDIRMRADNPDIMYVTELSAGVHRSVDDGQTWIPINQGILVDTIGATNIFCLTIDPHDDNTIWAGTQITGHIYRSTDGGQTWEQRDNGIPHDDISVRGITIDPHNQNVIYAGVEAGPMAWGGPGTKGHVYRSTDAGLNWTRIWEGNNMARYVWIDPRDSNRLYVSTGIFDREAANGDRLRGIYNGVGLVRSMDGGETWTVPADLAGAFIPSVFMHPENPDILLAAVTDPPEMGGVYMTRDGGAHWERILGNPGVGADAVEIAAGDTNVWYAATEDYIWRSDDAGQTWQGFPMETPDRKAGLPIDLQVDPRDPYRIFVNNYSGGNMLSTNGGQTWVDASRGYTGAHIGGLAVMPANSATVFAGSNTASFSSGDGGQTWISRLLYRLESVVFDPSASLSDTPHILAGDNGGRVWHSTDGGQTWDSVRVVDLMAEVQAGRLDEDNHILRALAVAPSDGQIVYAGFAYYQGVRGHWSYATQKSAGFHRSHDGGYTWERVDGVPFEDTGILAIAVHPNDSQTLYTATAMGLYISHDGGDIWQPSDALNAVVFPLVNDPDFYPTRQAMVYDVVIDPFDPQVIYAATIQAGVFRSADGGATWTQAAAGMDPNEPIHDLEPDQNRPGVLYASSWFSGVLVSTDGAQSWQPLTTGLDFKGMRQLALSFDGSVLYAATISRGIYRLGTP